MRDQRALDALGLGFTQQSQLGNLTSLFGNLGPSVNAGSLQSILGAAGGLRTDQSFRNEALASLLGLGTSAMGGAQSAFAQLQQALQNALFIRLRHILGDKVRNEIAKVIDQRLLKFVRGVR